jgi:hypothetical protein
MNVLPQASRVPQKVARGGRSGLGGGAAVSGADCQACRPVAGFRVLWTIGSGAANGAFSTTSPLPA